MPINLQFKSPKALQESYQSQSEFGSNIAMPVKSGRPAALTWFASSMSCTTSDPNNKLIC
jgi:hypothetical protein